MKTSLAPTAADSGLLNGWSVTTTGQTITATLSDVLNGGASYPPLTVTVSVANSIASTVINTPTNAGIRDATVTGVQTCDLPAFSQVPDLTVALSHSGSFKQGDGADTYT